MHAEDRPTDRGTRSVEVITEYGWIGGGTLGTRGSEEGGQPEAYDELLPKSMKNPKENHNSNC